MGKLRGDYMFREIDRSFEDEVKKIAKRAGDSIMEIYKEEHIDYVNKEDASPVTKADYSAHEIIVRELGKFSNKLPLISEESSLIKFSERRKWDRYWLIDPLDGTKEFIKKNGEFTINIALISKGVPIFGVVYAPAVDELYWGSQSNGAWFKKGGYYPQKISCLKHKKGDTWKVVGSRSHPSSSMSEYLVKLGNYELIPMGSSLKICVVARGAAHLYPRFGPTSEWDTAAAHAVVRSAGGDIFTLQGEPLRYNQKDSLLNPQFIVRSL